jgi:predicted metal-dependent HD superfamily phosphohydrolase
MPQPNPQLPEWLANIDAQILAGIDARLFARVRSAYDSSGRVYHAWPHIVACVAEFRQMTFDNPRAVLLALLFHDAIYVAGRKNNEAKSAELANRTLTELSDVSESEREEISAMILLTASHHAVGKPSLDAMKMLDIDLSILGAEWPIYQAYAAGVRREFCPVVVSDFKFNIGRLKFLRSVQQQTNIFLTEEMQSIREQAAKENIAREISELEQAAGLIGRALARVL